MALSVTLRPAERDDYGDRRNTPIDTLVLHTTEGGSIAGALEHWKRAEIHASAHFVLDGRSVVQCVPEGMAAYACGNGDMNRRSISIEVVGKCDASSTWTPEVLAQLVTLTAEVCKRHGIPVHHGSPGILGHCDVPDPQHPRLRGGVSHHHDPGQHFMAVLFQDFLDDVRAEIAASEPLPLAEVKP